MKKIYLLIVLLTTGLLPVKAQTPNHHCWDLCEYVSDVKEVGATGAYTLNGGSGNESYAAQTYQYSGSGRIYDVEVSGDVPLLQVTRVRARVYAVDANNRPTTLLGTSQSRNWGWWESSETFHFSGGVNVNGNFAVSVELVYDWAPWEQLNLAYTGDGEGNAEDLASLAGSSTGFNWSSAMSDFSKDGDFYIVPYMRHDIHADFTESTQCVATGGSVSFTNESPLTTDAMFNMAPNFYEWDFGDGSATTNATSPAHTFTTAGVYDVTLTTYFDGYNSNCFDTYVVQVSVGTDVSAVSVTDASCYGSNDGEATVTGTGGSSPYTYSLNSGSFGSNSNFTNLSAGTYTVDIMDNLGCSASTTFTISEPTQIQITSTASTNASCGNSDGGLLIAASGGTGSLEYSIDGGSNYQASGSFTNLASGAYTVMVRDANGCTTSTSVTIGDVGAPSLSLLSYTNVSCNNGNDGSIVLIGSGGSGTLQYSIDGTTFQSSGTFTNVAAGVYGVLVKDAANCTSGMTVTISEPPAFSGFAATVTENVSCTGLSDGEIEITGVVVGGTGSYQYSVDGVNYQSSTTFSGLSAGTYSVSVRDAASCSETLTLTVTEPTVLGLTVSGTDATCNGAEDGTITAVATGGTPDYYYSLDGSDYQYGGDFVGLEAGTYTIWVMDDHDCSTATTFTINEPTVVTASFTTTMATCGNTDGGFLVSGAGGDGGPYQYSIDGTTFSSSGSFTGLAAGTYFVLIQDAGGCEEMYDVTVASTTGPGIGTYNTTDVSCFNGTDGTIDVTSVTGGTGALEYSVNGSPFQSSTLFTGLGVGPHQLTVRDAVGCVGTVTFTINGPAEIVVTAATTDATCNGSSDGTITVTATGGIGVLAYSIDAINYQSSNMFNVSAGVYLVSARDAGGCIGTTVVTITEPSSVEVNAGWSNVSCNGVGDGVIFANAAGGTGSISFSLDGSNFQASGTFTGLDGGSYQVYAQDANGCMGTFSVDIEEPDQLAMTYIIADVSCAGGDDGAIDIAVSGGTVPYTYVWSKGDNSEDIYNLDAGTYSVTVTDAQGCEISETFTIQEPSNPIIINGTVIDATGVSNNDGEIDITVTGGTAPYSFSWTGGATTEDVTGLTPGVYTVTVTDANGCVSTLGFTVVWAVGVAQIDPDLDVNLYPNPTSTHLNIEVAGAELDRIQVFNMVGKIVHDSSANGKIAKVAVSGFAPGLYFVRLTVGDQEITKRIEVLR